MPNRQRKTETEEGPLFALAGVIQKQLLLCIASRTFLRAFISQAPGLVSPLCLPPLRLPPPFSAGLSGDERTPAASIFERDRLAEGSAADSSPVYRQNRTHATQPPPDDLFSSPRLLVTLLRPLSLWP